MHQKEIAADLRVGRRENGLSNLDLAHLLDVDGARISRLENGKANLTPSEACALSLIYGKNVDGLFQSTILAVAQSLRHRLADMPKEPDYWKAHDRRLETLNTLAHTLTAITLPVYEA